MKMTAAPHCGSLMLAAFLVAGSATLAAAQETSLQKGVERAQQDLMDLRQDLLEAGKTTRQSFCEEVKRIGKALRRRFDRAPADDPGLDAARNALGLLDVLERDCQNPDAIPGRQTAANRVQEIIEQIDKDMGKW